MFKLAPFGSGQLFALTAPDLHVPGLLDDVCIATGHLSSQPSGPRSHGQCVMAASFASPLFRRLAGRGSSFRGLPSWWAVRFALSLACCLTPTRPSAQLLGGFSVRLRPPARHLVVLFLY